jgi:hypothetical protein
MLKDMMYKTELPEQYVSDRITAEKIAKLLNLSLRQVCRLIKNYREYGRLCKK